AGGARRGARRGLRGRAGPFRSRCFPASCCCPCHVPVSSRDASRVRRRRAPAPRFHGSSVPPPAQISKSEAAPPTGQGSHRSLSGDRAGALNELLLRARALIARRGVQVGADVGLGDEGEAGVWL